MIHAGQKRAQLNDLNPDASDAVVLFAGAVTRLHDECTTRMKHSFARLPCQCLQKCSITLTLSAQATAARRHMLLPIQGCNVDPLGSMRYFAIASPEFAKTHFHGGVHAEALATAPLIVFDRKDDLQWRFIRRITRARVSPPVHYLPTSTGFVKAAALGLGWCLAPETLIGSAVEEGRVVVLEAGRWLDVPLYWQHAAVRSETIENVSRALYEAAASALRQ